MTAVILDLAKSREGRDEGMATVLAHAKKFRENFYRYVGALPHGMLIKCEDIRAVWPFDHPHHHNAWSACWGQLIKRRWVVPLEGMIPLTDQRSHAHRSFLYRREWNW